MSKKSAILRVAADTGFTTKRITLYKYITPVALEGLIQHGDFKLTYRNGANDPFECLPRRSEFSDEILSHIGIISLTRNPKNHPMWGNYADKFRGACVEFSFDYFYTAPDKEPANKGEELALEGIEYKKMGTLVYFIQYWDDENDPSNDMRGGDVLLRCNYSSERSENRVMLFDCVPLTFYKTEQHQRQMKEKERIFYQKLWRQVSTKHPDWQYENEYRITLREDGCTRSQVVDTGETIHLSNKISRYITKIILGPLSEYSPEQIQEEINKHRQISRLPEALRIVKAEFPEHTFDLIIP